MLAVKRSAGDAPEVNLWECASNLSLPSSNTAAYSGFEAQRKHHQKSKTGVSVKDMCPKSFLIIFFISNGDSFDGKALVLLVLFNLEILIIRTFNLLQNIRDMTCCVDLSHLKNIEPIISDLHSS